MMNRLFSTNMKRLSLIATPTWLRRPIFVALISAGVVPLTRLLQELRSFRLSADDRLKYNGQVCKLRGLLNKEFDPVNHRITITDASETSTTVGAKLWLRETNKSLLLPQRNGYAVLIQRRHYVGTGATDFFINIPLGLLSKDAEDRLCAMVNTYKLASKRYAINYI